ncbi:MAG: TonB-dependent receptor [Desulfobulbaceae bacterium]|nr:TonB-dependent receptor [Desulfobulbaceae bacterium]
MRKICIVAMISMGWVSQAMASQQGDINLYDLSLEELMQVEVSIASRQPETMRQVPSAVTVFTRNEIREMGIANVYDLLNYIPGFQTTRTIDVVNQSLVHSRGVASLNGEVLFLLNGHRLNENSTGNTARYVRTLSTTNIKQVEVIRGPGSALYGSNAFLGVVNIITETGENDADLHTGSFDNLGGHATITKTFGSLAVDASLSYDGDRGQEYTRGEDYPQGPQSTRDPQQNLNFYSSLLLHGTRLDLGYMKHKEQDFLTFNGVAPAGEAWSKSAYTLIALSHDWELTNALELKGGMSYSRHELAAVGWFGPANPTAPPATRYYADRLLGPYSQNSAYEADLDLAWHIDSTSDLLTGLSYRHEGTDTLGHYTNYWSDVPGIEAQPRESSYLGGSRLIEEVPSLDSREKFLDNYGLYAQYRRDLTNTIHTTVGLRFDQYEVVGTTNNPRLSLVWDAGQDFTLKAFWGTAFRAPSLAELYTNSQKSIGNINLKPETIATTELVCLKRFRAVELEGVYFHNHLSDAIERKAPVSSTDSRQTWINGSDQNYDGLELRIIWNPLSALRLTLTHTHVFSGLESNTYNDFSSFIAAYHIGRWRFNVNGIYREQDEDGPTGQGDYTIVNAKFSYALNESFHLYSKVDNLFDHRYVNVEADSSSTYFDTVPNQGLRWGVGLESQW